MYGAIYGDLAGSVYEYNQFKKVFGINPDTLVTKDSFYSDDTILTIAVLEALLNDFDYDQYLRMYIKKYQDYLPAYKPYFDTVFSPNMMKWARGNEMGQSTGNGAMMRISPVGFMCNSLQDVIYHARLATIPSHNSEEAIEAAKKIALVIFYLRNGYSREEIFTRLNIKPKYQPFSKFNLTCSETINNCLYALYVSTGFEDAIRTTLLMGGDTDTNCCIVGSMAESLYGLTDDIIDTVDSHIPEEFIKVLRRAYE